MEDVLAIACQIEYPDDVESLAGPALRGGRVIAQYTVGDIRDLAVLPCDQHNSVTLSDLVHELFGLLLGQVMVDFLLHLLTQRQDRLIRSVAVAAARRRAA